MQIILLEKINNLGDLGELIVVKSGYARNFLLPTRKALIATTINIKLFERCFIKFKSSLNIIKENIKVRVNKIRKLSNIIIFTKVKNKIGELFNVINSTYIAKIIVEKIGININKNEILLTKEITNIGKYKIKIQTYDSNFIKLNLIIINQNKKNNLGEK